MASVKLNFASTLYANAANIGGQLLLVPVYLRFWGTERYGWWLTAFAIPACFTFIDCGIGNSLGNSLTMAYERKEFKSAQQMLNSAWKYQFMILVGCLACFAAALTCLPVQRWLALERLSCREFIATSLVLCLYTCLSIQSGIFTAIFRAASRFHQFVWWYTNARVSEVILTALGLLGGAHLLGVAALIAANRVAFIVFCWMRTQSLVTEIHFSWSGGSLQQFKVLLLQGTAFMSLPISSGLVNQGSAVVVNHQIGAVSVVTISVARQVARLYWNVMNALFVAIHPELTRAYALDDRHRLQRLYAGAMGAVLWTALPALLGMVLFGPFAISVWTKSAVPVTRLLLLACGIEAVVAALGQNAALPAYASNRCVGVCAFYLLFTLAAFLPALLLLGMGGLPVLPCSFAATGVLFASYAFVVGTRIVRSYPGTILRLSVRTSTLPQVGGRWARATF